MVVVRVGIEQCDAWARMMAYRLSDHFRRKVLDMAFMYGWRIWICYPIDTASTQAMIGQTCSTVLLRPQTSLLNRSTVQDGSGENLPGYETLS